MGSFSPVPAATLLKRSCWEGNKPPEGGGEGIKTRKGVNFHSSWLSVRVYPLPR